jgi:hypothetical protein
MKQETSCKNCGGKLMRLRIGSVCRRCYILWIDRKPMNTEIEDDVKSANKRAACAADDTKQNYNTTNNQKV